jgi:hypothetical protein
MRVVNLQMLSIPEVVVDAGIIAKSHTEDQKRDQMLSQEHAHVQDRIKKQFLLQ